MRRLALLVLLVSGVLTGPAFAEDVNVNGTGEVVGTFRDGRTLVAVDSASVTPAATPTPTPTPTPTETPTPTPTPTPDPGAVCTRVGTPYTLSQTLLPGETGCVHAGTYGPVSGDTAALFNTAGTAIAPITLRSYPGERAKLTGVTRINKPYVVLDSLDHDCTGVANGCILVMAFDDTLRSLDLTNGNGSGGSCIHVGGNGWGAPAGRLLLTRSKIHDCGTIGAAGGYQVHAIYFENSANSTVTENVFWNAGGYTAHLYPNAQGNHFTHNVVADNSCCASVFGGSGSFHSANNDVGWNVFAYTGSVEPAIHAENAGKGNTAHDNCMWSNWRNVDTTLAGFTYTANVNADPAFVNRAMHDYRQGPSSGCLSVVGYDTAALIGG